MQFKIEEPTISEQHQTGKGTITIPKIAKRYSGDKLQVKCWEWAQTWGQVKVITVNEEHMKSVRWDMWRVYLWDTHNKLLKSGLLSKNYLWALIL